MAKLTQIKRIELALKENGFVSRNHYLDVPYDKITRLSDIILKLREQGWQIETDTTTDPRDTIYRAKVKRVEAYNVLYPDGTKKLVTKNIFI